MKMFPIRLISLTLIVLLIFPCYVFSQWQWQNPSPQGNNLKGVQFVDATTAFSVGDGGTILKTSDRGATWTRLDCYDYIEFNGLYFVNPNIGYVVGQSDLTDQGYIYKTIDGGLTWTQLPYIFSDRGLCVWFMDANTGFVGTFFALYKTTDGGLTWDILSQPPLCTTYSSIFFVDSLNGYVGTFSSIYKTTDGGNTWTICYDNPAGNSLSSIYFSSINVGFAVDLDGKILRTTDGGQNWSSTVVHSWLRSVFFSTPQIGCVLGYPYQYLTLDGGYNWQQQQSGSDLLFAGSFADSYNGIVVGQHGATLFSQDGGLSWDISSSHITVQNLNSSLFIGKDLGFIAGDSGTILKTTDGGDTWQNCTSGTNNRLWGLSFTSSTEGYACGLHNTILKTTNSGSSWFPVFQSSSTDYSFTCIQFPSQNVGYALCPLGLFKTTDAGNSWAFKTSTGTSNLSMFFTSIDTGYIVGDTGTIRMTKDGGNSYNSLNTGVSNDLSSIYFISKNVAFVAGYNLVLKTFDAGNSWQIKYAGSLISAGFHAIDFSDSLHGYIIGWDTLLVTKDGGETWLKSPTNHLSWYLPHSICFTDSTTGYLTGMNGMLLKTTSGIITSTFRQQMKDQIMIFPNPNNGRFSVRMDENESGVIEIFNLIGKSVYKSQFTNCSVIPNILLPSGSSGIYILRIAMKGKVYSTKIIVNQTL